MFTLWQEEMLWENLTGCLILLDNYNCLMKLCPIDWKDDIVVYSKSNQLEILHYVPQQRSDACPAVARSVSRWTCLASVSRWQRPDRAVDSFGHDRSVPLYHRLNHRLDHTLRAACLSEYNKKAQLWLKLSHIFDIFQTRHKLWYLFSNNKMGN